MNINFIDENNYKLSEVQRLTLQLIQKLISMFNLGVNFYLLLKRIKAQKKHNLISSLKLELLISCIIVSLSYFLTVGAHDEKSIGLTSITNICCFFQVIIYSYPAITITLLATAIRIVIFLFLFNTIGFI